MRFALADELVELVVLCALVGEKVQSLVVGVFEVRVVVAQGEVMLRAYVGVELQQIRLLVERRVVRQLVGVRMIDQTLDLREKLLSHRRRQRGECRVDAQVRRRLWQFLTLAVEVRKVEQLVADYGSADGKAGLRRVARAEAVSDRLAVRQHQGPGGGPRALAQEVEGLAIDVVRAALGDGVYLRTDSSAILGVVLRADDLKLLDGRLREGERRSRAAGLLAEEVVVRRRAVDVVVRGDAAGTIRGDSATERSDNAWGQLCQ